MKKIVKGLLVICFALTVFWTADENVNAQEDTKILSGIYAEDMPLGGMTVQQAGDMIKEYVNQLCSREITLVAVNGNEVKVTPQDMGFYWSNQDILEEAVKLGRGGNIVQRYKAAKDLEHQNKVYELEFGLDQELLKHILAEQCSVYNQEAIDATLTRINGSFEINPGQAGMVVDEEASAGFITDFFNNTWDGQDAVIELKVSVDDARGTQEELSKVRDVLGTFTTSFSTSNSSRSANVRNGCRLIDGITLYPGDEFSACETVTPFTAANGYYMAGSYLNGQVVDSLGGGICQVSTTLYNAVLLAELEVTERHNHSMIVTYVDPSADAAIAESSGKDFKFRNNTEAPIYIEGVTTDDKKITFTIYGMETRDSGHQVSYFSEIISKTYPDTEVIYADESQPVGNVSVQSAHIGYKANLWKVVTENGAEVSREIVNSSTYTMAPRTATVGVSTSDPNVYNEIMAAISTNNIDHVKNVAAALAAATAPPVLPEQTAVLPEAAPPEMPIQ